MFTLNTEMSSEIRILLVEDDLVERTHVETLLQQLGHSVMATADNTLDAITLFSIDRPDLVLTDIGLKKGDSGIDLVHRLNKIDEVPVIFLTANDTDDIFNEAKKTSPYAYISKPVEPKTLERHIELVLQRSETVKKKVRRQKRESEYFYTKVGNKLKKMPIDGISSIEVEGKYSCITIEAHNYHVKISLTDLLEKLPDDQFLRVSRNHVVNLECIADIDLQNQTVEVDGKNISFSRTYKDQLMKRINLI